ncbi:MAG: hypothetical protein JSW28_07610 [Thermoplasmata archaeon]|nr:MAG: hypothetical protein JSW28_07610 [Thermoplasmata archaeon]
MNGLSATDMWCISFVIVVVVCLIILAYFAIRKVKGGELPQGQVNLLVPQLDYLFRYRGWKTKLDYQKGKITVSKDDMVAADIYLKPKPDGSIEILHATNAGTMGWLLVVAFLFVFSLIGALAGLILHIYSRKFAREEVIPMIMTYHGGRTPSYPAPSPPQQSICPRCGHPLKYRWEAQRLFCENCEMYV